MILGMKSNLDTSIKRKNAKVVERYTRKSQKLVLNKVGLRVRVSPLALTGDVTQRSRVVAF